MPGFLVTGLADFDCGNPAQSLAFIDERAIESACEEVARASRARWPAVTHPEGRIKPHNVVSREKHGDWNRHDP